MNKNVKIILGLSALLILAIILFIIFGGKKETFTVSFYTDGGTVVESQTVEKGERASRPSNPTKEGYIFDNWYISDNIYDFTSKVTKNITLSAKWIKDNSNEEDDNEEVIAEKYTITFNSNGGSNVDSVIVEKGQKIVEPKEPTRKNYEFVSWQLNGKDYDFSSEVISDITLIAKWKKVTTTNNTTNNNNNNNNNSNNNNSGNEEEKPSTPETPKSYTIKFDTDGGNTIANQTVEEGKLVTKPSEPKKDGYTFDGWYYNDKAYDFSTGVTSDITLVAKWKKDTVVAYKVEGTDSQVGQVRIFVIKDNTEKVEELIDIEFIDGNVKKDVPVSKNGLTINKDKYKAISNPRIK